MKKTEGNRNTQKLLQVLVVCAVICACPVITFAQATFGSGTTIIDTPIDGGLSLLVIAGVGYGAKKLYNKRKDNK